MEKWVEELRSFGTKDISIVVAGNKSDMKNQMQIDKNEVEEYCKRIGAKHFFTSAKSGIGINDMFKSLAESNIYIHIQVSLSKFKHKKVKERKRKVYKLKM